MDLRAIPSMQKSSTFGLLASRPPWPIGIASNIWRARLSGNLIAWRAPGGRRGFFISPAGRRAEILEFIKTRSFQPRIDFTLADFDGETLEYVQRSLRKEYGELPSKLKINY